MAINSYLRTSSIDVDGNINFKRNEEKKKYNSWLLGTAKRIDLGHEIVSNNETSRPPSWTQTDLNLNHSFVIHPLSSSFHENVCLNTFLSGNAPLEQNAVPASASSFYSKKQIVHAVYKLTASSNVKGNANQDALFSALTGYRFTLAANQALGNYQMIDGGAATGSYSGYPPVQKTFVLNVPDYGKIIDIKVWVEIVCPRPVTVGTMSTTELGSISISLRSPNVYFFSGLPVLNDRRIDKQLNHTGTPQTTGGLKVSYKNCYLLWDGDEQANSGENAGKIQYGSDYSIRTIFTDSSKNINPRHFDILSVNNGYPIAFSNLSSGSKPSKKYNDYFSVNSGTIPWTSETGLVADNRSFGAMTGSPPQGWLTGPGGTNAVNEFPTTGINWGLDNVKPLYPLLDDIVEIRQTLSSSLPSGLSAGRNAIFKKNSYIGFRPGLRGTEINGDWELVIGSTAVSTIADVLGTYEFWFRQFRLEFLYEKNEYSKSNKAKKRSNLSDGKSKLINIISGSDIGSTQQPDATFNTCNMVYDANYLNEYGTTVGIVDDTGSLYSNDWAVFSRITGSLADSLSGSNHAHYKYKFLNNEFGTPFLSLASGSGIHNAESNDISYNKRLINDVLTPEKTLNSSNSIKGLLSLKNSTMKTRDLTILSIENELLQSGSI